MKLGSNSSCSSKVVTCKCNNNAHDLLTACRCDNDDAYVDLIMLQKAGTNSEIQLQQQCRQLHLQVDVGQSLLAPDCQNCSAMINTVLPHNSLLHAQWLLLSTS